MGVCASYEAIEATEAAEDRGVTLLRQKAQQFGVAMATTLNESNVDAIRDEVGRREKMLPMRLTEHGEEREIIVKA